MKIKTLTSKGFTLIEAVIAIAIVVVILLGLFALYDNYTKTYNSQIAIGRVAGSASAAANELQSAVLQASHVVLSHTFAGTTYNSGAGTLVLEIPSIDSSGEVIEGKFDYIVFYANGTKLFRLTEADGSSSRRAGLKQLSDTLNALTFTYDNVDVTEAAKIGVNLQTQVTAGHQTFPYSLSQTLYLRNQ